MFYNLAEVYPEFKHYKLTNLLDDSTILVTDSMLKEVFTDPQELQRLYSGRHKTFMLEEVQAGFLPFS